MVKFSFVMPIYGNVGNNLQYCMESLLNQDFRDFEIIISGSKIFENNQIINGIKIKNIEINNTRSHGKLLNEAIKISEGEYIHIWMPDLVCYSDYLKRLNFYILTYGDDTLYIGKHIDIRSVNTRNNFENFFFKSSDLAEGALCIHKKHYEPFYEEFVGFSHYLQEWLARMWKRMTFICLQNLDVVHLPHPKRCSLEEQINDGHISWAIYQKLMSLNLDYNQYYKVKQ